MKKFIMALVCLMTMVVLTSCGSTYEVTASYDVCYPDGTRTIENKTEINHCFKRTAVYVSCRSFGGTNYISAYKNGSVEGNFVSSTAPMRLNSWKVRRIEKNKNYIEDIYMKDIIGH